jgi:predicted DsbA family dithiol-disulfide isomerase
VRVERLQREYLVDVEWRPFELHPELPPEGILVRDLQRGGRYRSEYYEHIRALARDEGIDMVEPTVIPNSLPALEAAEFARDAGRLDEFHRGLFAAYFERDENIGDVEQLQLLAYAHGLDGDELARALRARRYRPRVEESTERARERGIMGTPSFVFDDRYDLVGAQDYSVFQSVVQRLGAKRKAPGGAETERGLP